MFSKNVLLFIVLLFYSCSQYITEECPTLLNEKTDQKTANIESHLVNVIQKNNKDQILPLTYKNLTFCRAINSITECSILNSVFDSTARIQRGNSVELISCLFKDSLIIHNDANKIDSSNYIFRETLFKDKLKITDGPILLDFRNCNFQGLVDLTSTPKIGSFGIIFKDSKAHFTQNVNFNGSKFCQSPRLKKVHFYSAVSFESTEFYCDTLSFDSTYFLEAPNFDFVKLPSVLALSDFKTSHWKENLDFSKCLLSTKGGNNKIAKCVLKISYSDVRNLTDLNAARLVIPSSLFELEFGEEIPLHRRLTIIKALKKTCLEHDMEDSYQDWDILYKETNNIHRWKNWGLVLNIVEHYYWNFGYSQWMVVGVWLPLFFLLFWSITYVNLHYITTTVYLDPELGTNFLRAPLRNEIIHPEKMRMKIISAIAHNRAGYSFFLTAVIFFGFKIKHEAVNYGNHLGMIYIYLMYLSGLFLLANAVGFFFR